MGSYIDQGSGGGTLEELVDSYADTGESEILAEYIRSLRELDPADSAEDVALHSTDIEDTTIYLHALHPSRMYQEMRKLGGYGYGEERIYSRFIRWMLTEPLPNEEDVLIDEDVYSELVVSLKPKLNRLKKEGRGEALEGIAESLDIDREVIGYLYEDVEDLSDIPSRVNTVDLENYLKGDESFGERVGSDTGREGVNGKYIHLVPAIDRYLAMRKDIKDYKAGLYKEKAGELRSSAEKWKDRGKNLLYAAGGLALAWGLYEVTEGMQPDQISEWVRPEYLYGLSGLFSVSSSVFFGISAYRRSKASEKESQLEQMDL